MSWLDPLNKVRLNRLASLAASALRDGNLHRAEELNKRALHIMRESSGNGLSAAGCHSDLAHICADQNRSAEAESHYRTALEITERALGKDHVAVTKPLYELADFLYNNALKDRIDIDDASEPLQELSDLLYYNSMDETDGSAKTQSLIDAEALYMRATKIEQTSTSSRID